MRQQKRKMWVERGVKVEGTFPDPTWPTTANTWPGSTLKDTSVSVLSSDSEAAGHLTVTPSKSTRQSAKGGRSAFELVLSISSSRRNFYFESGE